MAEFVELLNKERKARGLGALLIDPKLTLVANRKAADIQRTGEFAHVIDGNDERDLADEAGYPAGRMDEVLCWSESTARDALKAWLGSPVHKAVLLDPDYRAIGVSGPHQGSPYWGLWVVEVGLALTGRLSDQKQKDRKDNKKNQDVNTEAEPRAKNPALVTPVSTQLATSLVTPAITRKTPFRQIGPVALDTFKSVLSQSSSPLGPVEELYRIAGNDSALFLVQSIRESSLGTSELAGRTKNPLGLKLPDNSGFCTYGCWATAVAEWRLRLRDPQYKSGVYYPSQPGLSDPYLLSLEDFLTIYVGGPGCLSSGMATCANGETRDSINRYIDATVVDLNKYLGGTTDPDPGDGNITFGLVPNPSIINRIIPGNVPGGVWVPVGSNSAFDHLGTRTFRGFVIHIMEGSLDGTDAYFRNDARMSALTDFGVGWSTSRNAYAIYQWNSMASARAPWASGPATDPEGDGPAFLRAYGVNAVNRDLRSIEFAGNANQVLPAESITRGVNLMAYLADQARVPHTSWPYLNGLALIYGHREFSPKTCPGDWLWNQIPSMSDRVGEILQRYQTS